MSASDPATPSCKRAARNASSWPVDEVELCRKVPEDEAEHRDAIVIASRDGTQQPNDQQQKRKQREQRVIGDRRSVGQVVYR
jgi:hypothetical protein